VSTVSQEVARHGRRSVYQANQAEGEAWESALRPKRCLLSIHVKLQQIETIYRSLFIQARGVLKKELMGHLRSKRRIRRSQHARIFRDSRGQIVDAHLHPGKAR
jgi:IS30 family transposase